MNELSDEDDDYVDLSNDTMFIYSMIQGFESEYQEKYSEG